jgi:hypothetical protein
MPDLSRIHEMDRTLDRAVFKGMGARGGSLRLTFEKDGKAFDLDIDPTEGSIIPTEDYLDLHVTLTERR